ncbi:MAG TPA: class I SAM-dependent methyltransferase [Tepidisphaeraceae bacterium]|jgi:cyclopropane fatty-acyl-phospholipid synthase-like methyltransferase|nr:class I SAM-dependent methyltransferase [Tepidisphaeraceae bacterium]
MLELLDPKSLDPIAYDGGLLARMQEFSLLEGKRIGWHYVMDYTWLATRFAAVYRPGMRVIDIGCGPGAVHGFLEAEFDVDILGIDMERWEKDYVDLKGNFTDPAFRAANDLCDESIDIILSGSAFEHNPPEDHRALIQVCMDTLRPGGVLLTTFAAASKETHFFKPTHQWNLTQADIESLYGDRFDQYDYDGVWNRWREHREMAEGCRKRFKRFEANDPPYISVAAEKRKAA